MREEATFAKKHGQQAGHQSKPTAPVTQGHTCFSRNPTQRAPEAQKNYDKIPTSPNGASR